MMNSDRTSHFGPTRELARWVSSLRYGDLPARTREVVRILLLDTLGCGAYGYVTPWAKMLLQWARAGAPARGDATVWGESSPSLRASDAALVNGTSVHAFELDDYHQAKLHPGAVVIPAAVAMAEQLGSGGERLVTAIAAGYEVMIRSSLALNPSATRLRGWHLTGVCGPLGAAAACASLMGLNGERTAWALGLAGTQGAGLWAFNADGTMSKRFHAGRAAQSGVMAAELAALGFTGPTQIYEFHDGGVLKAFSDASDPAPLTRDLGKVFHLDATSIKPYACCGSTHSYVDAALELRRRLGTPWDAKRPVRVGMARVVDVQCGFDYVPGSALNAQMSLRYVVAAALMEGQALPPQFSDAKIADPALAALAGNIRCEHDPALDKLYPARFAAWVAAEDKGQWVRVDVLDPLGSSANPVDAKGVIEKFRGINPQLPVDDIAEMALDVERHSIKKLLGLIARGSSKKSLSVLRTAALVASAAFAALMTSQSLMAQNYPKRPIRLVVPFAPGGGTDIMARSLAQKLSEAFGQIVVVDNRPGGGGTLGTETVVRANPDGYTMIIVSGSYAANAAVYKLPYDSVNDIAAVALVGETGNAIALPNSVPIRSIKELIAYDKASPGKLNYGSTGTGGFTHLITELFNQLAGTKMTHVPYKGTGPALNDLLGGQIQVLFGSLPSTIPLIRQNRVRGIGVTTAKRSNAIPDVPAIAEVVPGYEAVLWYGVWGPRQLPKDLVKLWNSEIRKALKRPDLRERLANEGLDPADSPPERFSEIVRRDVAKWQKVVKAGNIKAGN